jgi:pimeloyl-ACP methyl ester carboxylesterase
LRLAATRWAGTGPPVLLLHGLASQRRFWNLVVPHLAGLPVCALDQRGHGDSDKPDEGYDLFTVARDAATALDALGWSRAVVVGHSWGAAVACTLAAEFPERVLAVVAVDGGLGSPLESGEDRETLRERFAPPHLAEPPDRLAELLAEGKEWWNDAVADAVLPIFELHDDGLARAKLTFERHMMTFEGLLDYDAPGVLPRIAAPFWAVTAQVEDRLERAMDLLQRPRGIRLRGAVHDVPLQWPALVAGAVRAATDEAGTAEGRA